MPRDVLIDVGLISVLIDHPVGQAFMQIRTQLLRETSVGSFGDERVRESPPTARLVLRMHQPFPFECGNRTLQVFDVEVRDEGVQPPGPKATSFDGGTFKH